MADLTGTIGIVIADDHEMVRRGLVALFEGISRTKVVGLAADGLEAIALCRKHRPGLLTLDVAMPYANGAEVFAECRRWSPATRIAVFTGYTSVGMLADWVSAGVDGLFLKTCGETELRAGLEVILSGRKYISADIVKRLEGAPSPPQLTLREREVLMLIAAGLTTIQIGDKLTISHKTVEKHRASLFEKLDATSMAALVTAAFRAGLLDHLGEG
jgi:DNA-binding NarL/FixJ family response regulator